MKKILIISLIIILISSSFLSGIFYSVKNFQTCSFKNFSKKEINMIDDCLGGDRLKNHVKCYSEHAELSEQGYFDSWDEKIVEKVIKFMVRYK